LSGSLLVTGLGTVGAFGSSAESLERALAAAAPPLTEVDRSAAYHLPESARQACLVFAAGVSLAGWLSPGEARRMSPPSKLAVAAARMALRGASLGEPSSPRNAAADATATVIATAFGPSSNSEGLLRQILLESPESASPFLFTESVANAPAAQIAIAARAHGPSVTICQREAGPLLAVGQAAAAIAAGKAPRALTGSVDEMSPLLHALLDRFGALARSDTPGEDEAARPFDRRRSGFLAGEGATVLVIESEESARERGAAPLARVLAWGSAFDPTATATGWGRGHEGLARGLRRALGRAGLAPADIDLVVSGASGARQGDRLEALTLRCAFCGSGRPMPPVFAPKAVTGEYGGGILGAAVLAAGGARFGPTAGFDEPDPELGLVPYDGSPLPPPSTVLVTSLAAGGAAAWLVFGKP
jgi:3-oxoacyl-(acyl-carrier-protein) synthase